VSTFWQEKNQTREKQKEKKKREKKKTLPSMTCLISPYPSFAAPETPTEEIEEDDSDARSLTNWENGSRNLWTISTS
jgi:hypothetical protein